METIRTYINNLFAGLPKTEQVNNIKKAMLEQMEDKYNQYKSEGRSENEAVGQVISEFGSIDELTAELGIQPTDAAAEQYTVEVNKERAEEYIAASKRNAVLCSVGVGLCILAPALMLAVGGIFSENGRLMLVPLFVLIAAAVALFVVVGVRAEKYRDIEFKTVALDSVTEESVKERLNAFTPAFTVMIASGVALCIVAPLVLIILTNYLIGSVSVAVMLAIIAAAVAMFVYAGIRSNSLKNLLNTSDDKVRREEAGNSKAGRVFSAIEGFIWPATVAAFLIWGFRFDGWEISWILFPVVGILCGVIKSLIKAVAAK